MDRTAVQCLHLLGSDRIARMAIRMVGERQRAVLLLDVRRTDGQGQTEEVECVLDLLTNAEALATPDDPLPALLERHDYTT